MKPKLAAVFLLLVLAPLGLLAWLGARVVRDEQTDVREKFQALLAAALQDTGRQVARLVEEREREFLRLTDLSSFETGDLRERVRKSPLIQQLFVLEPDGTLSHPPPAGPLLNSEREFLLDARRVLADRERVRILSAEERAAGAPEKGWHAWQGERGPHLIFWRRTESGHVVGVEADRVRLLADLMARLPGTDPKEPTLVNGSIALTGSNGALLYQWGGYQPAEGEIPRANLPLGPPLNSWRLEYFVPAGEWDAALRGSLRFSLLTALLAAGLALTGLAIYFYREQAREVREASVRMNFVNQVSHELKTPLTNIRLYAELLENQLDGDEKSRRHLAIVVAESQRLSRLIGNVLTFARRQRKSLVLRRSPGCVDEIIAATLEAFRPALAAKEVEFIFSGHAPAAVLFDADAVGQILGNLFSNVEKYGASGGRLSVESRQAGGQTLVTVSDAGPGIRKEQSEKIFEPFHRLSHRLDDGVTGTGIGLHIARELARLHGGDLVLEPSGVGACFRLAFSTPPASGVEEHVRPAGQTASGG